MGVSRMIQVFLFGQLSRREGKIEKQRQKNFWKEEQINTVMCSSIWQAQLVLTSDWISKRDSWKEK